MTTHLKQPHTVGEFELYGYFSTALCLLFVVVHVHEIPYAPPFHSTDGRNNSIVRVVQEWFFNTYGWLRAVALRTF